MKRRFLNARISFLVGAIAAASAGFLSLSAHPASAAQSCVSNTYAWSDFSKIHNSQPTFNPGLTIPTPGPGETLTVRSMAYSAYDGYNDGNIPSRMDQNQKFEEFGVRIGDVDVSQLSPDLPDSPAEGAAGINYSGVQNGTFSQWSGVRINGGAVQFRHSSLYGVTDPLPNSMTVASISIVAELCSSNGAVPTPGFTASATPPPTPVVAPAPVPAPAPVVIAPAPVAVVPAPVVIAPVPAPGPKPVVPAAPAIPAAKPAPTAPALAAPAPAQPTQAPKPTPEPAAAPSKAPQVEAAPVTIAAAIDVVAEPAIVVPEPAVVAVEAAPAPVAQTTIAPSTTVATTVPVHKTGATVTTAVVSAPSVTRSFVAMPGSSGSRGTVIALLCLVALVAILIGSGCVLFSNLSQRVRLLENLVSSDLQPELF